MKNEDEGLGFRERVWVVNVRFQIDGGASKSVWPNSEIKISTYPILSLIKGKGRPPKLHRQSGHGVLERVCVWRSDFSCNQCLCRPATS